VSETFFSCEVDERLARALLSEHNLRYDVFCVRPTFCLCVRRKFFLSGKVGQLNLGGVKFCYKNDAQPRLTTFTSALHPSIWDIIIAVVAYSDSIFRYINREMGSWD